MLTLAQGADGSVIKHDAGVQTDEMSRWSLAPLLQIAILVACILAVWKSLSLERLWETANSEAGHNTSANTSSAGANESSMGAEIDDHWDWFSLIFNWCPITVCTCCVAYAIQLRANLNHARLEIEELEQALADAADRQITPMPARTSDTTVMPAVSSHTGVRGSNAAVEREIHVYCTLRKGKAYHCRRDCKCLNNADEIVRIGLAEAKERGYKPCGGCFGGSRKQK